MNSIDFNPIIFKLIIPISMSTYRYYQYIYMSFSSILLYSFNSTLNRIQRIRNIRDQILFIFQTKTDTDQFSRYSCLF